MFDYWAPHGCHCCSCFLAQVLISVLFIWHFQMWPDLIQKAKDGGLDVIQTYVFWNGHEPSQGKVMHMDYILRFLFLFSSSGLR